MPKEVSRMESTKVPQHFRYLIPIVEVLKQLGGSGRSSEVIDLIVEKLRISDAELQETIKSGQSKLINQIHWAKFLLKTTGYMDSSQHGVWTLTEKGLKSNLSQGDLPEFYKIKKQWSKEHKAAKEKRIEACHVLEDKEIGDEDENESEGGYKIDLLSILQSLPPAGFERICQRLLREFGFEQVTVTGKTGDGGIDGIGMLQVNPLVSFKELFKCKRYKGGISPSIVRDFRGSMMGRADKGIIMTTGTFTHEAKKEARRDGVPPIELVDADKMVEMFEKLELGLKPVKGYEVDLKFFEEFQM
jgi:restriction system protein